MGWGRGLVCNNNRTGRDGFTAYGAGRVLLLLGLVAASSASAGDWPAFRYDAQRTAASPHGLAAELHLQWTREYPPPHRAWKEPLNQQRMTYDAGYEPIVVGTLLVFGSSREDCLIAVDTGSGSERWRLQVDGPVRIPAVAHAGNIYASCDDGYLYCVDAETGKLRWRFRGGPADRKLLGNERLISAWPARGGPVVGDGVVYFAAGIWPFMGTHLHALDAETGKVVWTNDTSGSLFLLQPKRAPGFAGVGPQGPLVISGDRLLVPGGRTVPAGYDRRTGKFLYFNYEGYRGDGPVTHRVAYRRLRYTGGSTVSAVGKYFFNDAYMFDVATGGDLKRVGKPARVLSGNVMYQAGDPVQAIALGTFRKDGPQPERGVQEYTYDTLWSAPFIEADVMIKAGTRLYAAGDGQVAALDLPENGSSPSISFQAAIAGTGVGLVAGDEKLFVSTDGGRLYCFGPQKTEPRIHRLAEGPRKIDAESAALAERVLNAAKVREGYCLVLGAGDGRLTEALARGSKLRLIVLEPDEQTARAARQRMHEAGLRAPRVSVLHFDPTSPALPPYLASLIVSGAADTADFAPTGPFAKRVFHCLRPYGGAACFSLTDQQHAAFTKACDGAQLANAKLSRTDGVSLLSREGGLPGGGSWTHHYGNAGNANTSDDSRVKLPLGVLWFGGSSHEATLPRHGRPPTPQILDGRVIVEGPGGLRAMDVFTGRVLWDASLPELGKYFNTVIHQPGAISLGGNYVTTHDGIYVAHGAGCVRIDPATGRRLAEYQLPGGSDSGGKPPQWSYINVAGDYLIAGTAGSEFEGSEGLPGSNTNADYSSSRRLAVLDRQSGKVLWQRSAQFAFRHNAIAAGSGLLFCTDYLAQRDFARLKRRGGEVDREPRLLALDLASGKEVWSSSEHVLGSWLSYSGEHDALVISGGNRGAAFRGRTGELLWSGGARFDNYRFMLLGKSILTQTTALHLLDGEPIEFRDPITGKQVPFRYTRHGEIGCTNAVACPNLVTFRSGSVGYLDLARGHGMGMLGGFRPSCTNNVIAADGLLVAPDYTRTCKCAYQNQTSLALVHMPSVETWTEFGYETAAAPVQRLGVNFGAPGDRLADDGTMWIEYPLVGGRSPNVDISVDPPEVRYQRRHETRVAGGGHRWVTASAAVGARRVRVTLVPDGANSPSARYTVTLHFAAPTGAKPGQSLCSVGLQGKTVLRNFDVAREGSAENPAVVKQFKGVEVSSDLVLTLEPANDTAGLPRLCGLKVEREE